MGVSDTALTYLKDIKSKKISELNDDDMYYFEELLAVIPCTGPDYLRYKCQLDALKKDVSECETNKESCKGFRAFPSCRPEPGDEYPEKYINLLKDYTVEDTMIYKLNSWKLSEGMAKIVCGPQDEVSKNIDKMHEEFSDKTVKLVLEMGKIVADNTVVVDKK